MIVARIEGGLGNQLFQYAFGLQLAKTNRTELVLDLSAYASKPPHGYLLDRFAISARELHRDEYHRVPGRYRNRKRSLLDVFRLNRHAFWRLRERPFGFDERYLAAGDNRYLVGYWQGERFFRDVRSSIHDQFQVAVPMSARTHELRERMFERPSMAIHVRRGDYITNQPMAVRNLSLSYYRECVGLQLQSRPRTEVYVFSNDIAWCRENLKLPCPIHWVEHTSNTSAHEDLWLMTSAESIAIANSTFSWWGAYLGQRTDRTVYAPSEWFYPGTINDADLHCGRWKRVVDPQTRRQAA